jgi:hypothetical protein
MEPKYLFKNIIDLNRLNNTQYDVYNSIKSVKTLWKALGKKFKVEVVIMKRFIVSKFLNLRMTSNLSGQICSCIQY